MKSVTLPAAGGSFIDPVFGSKMIRVTDSRDGTRCTHSYAYWPAFNSDGTRLMLACDDTIRLFRFDPAADRLTPDGTLSGADGHKVQFDGATWSYSTGAPATVCTRSISQARGCGASWCPGAASRATPC